MKPGDPGYPQRDPLAGLTLLGRARLDGALARVAEAVRDGFQAHDLAVLVREAGEVAEAIGDDMPTVWTGAEKRAFAIAVLDRMLSLGEPRIDALVEQVIADADGPDPGIFRRLVVDPAVRRFAPAVLMCGLRRLAPAVIDLMVQATSGKVAINQSPGK